MERAGAAALWMIIFLCNSNGPVVVNSSLYVLGFYLAALRCSICAERTL